MVIIKNNQARETVRNKDYLRYSKLQHYFSCPHAYKLSQTYDPVFNVSNKNQMMKGVIFETFALDMNDSRAQSVKEEYAKRGTIGKMRFGTVERIIKSANKVKPWILTKEKLNEEIKILVTLNGVQHTLAGNPDVVGLVQLPGMDEPIRAISDTKYTGNLERVWGNKKSKSDFLQAIIYPYIWFLLTGEYLPFIYIIAEHTKDEFEPVIDHKIIISKPDDFKWMHNALEMITGDTRYRPNVSHYSCLGQGNMMGKCRFLSFCEYGKKLQSGTTVIQFENLDNR